MIYDNVRNKGTVKRSALYVQPQAQIDLPAQYVLDTPQASMSRVVHLCILDACKFMYMWFVFPASSPPRRRPWRRPNCLSCLSRVTTPTCRRIARSACSAGRIWSSRYHLPALHEFAFSSTLSCMRAPSFLQYFDAHMVPRQSLAQSQF